MTDAYTGGKDISFDGTVTPTGEHDAFAPRIKGMPYVAGMHGEGLEHSAAVAELTSGGATLEVGVFGDKVAKSDIINFTKTISVEYAWVDEVV